MEVRGKLDLLINLLKTIPFRNGKKLYWDKSFPRTNFIIIKITLKYCNKQKLKFIKIIRIIKIKKRRNYNRSL